MRRTPLASSLLASSLALLLTAPLLGGCGSDDSDDAGHDLSSPSSSTPGAPDNTGAPGAVGVSQGGAQDFGLFRQILENGELPGPETLDDRGFFAEHKLDYPTPDCGNDLCMHGLVGMMGNMINGANCTVLQIGMNSPLDVDALPRPPMHLVVSVDVSGSMLGEPMDALREGLDRMLDKLGPDDHLSLISFSDSAKVLLEAAPASDKTKLREAILGLHAQGSTNLYDGLFTALSLADKHAAPGVSPRVIFLSDGEATVGLINNGKLQSLAAAYARKGVPITSVGVGREFDVDAMRSIGEVGSGNFYFLEDPKAVAEVFSEEVSTFLYPVALDVHIEASVGSAYALRGVYGARTWQSDDHGMTLDIPSLFLAGRIKSSDPVEGGRRGGGGAIIVEVVPTGTGHELEKAVGSLTITWKKPTTGETVTQSVDLGSPYATSDLPPEGYFTSYTSEKGFVMLNLFAGFQIAARSARDGDARAADAVLAPLGTSVDAWLHRLSTPDPDIDDDLKYLRLFRQNLAQHMEATKNLPPAIPPNPWPLGYD